MYFLLAIIAEILTSVCTLPIPQQAKDPPTSTFVKCFANNPLCPEAKNLLDKMDTCKEYVKK